VSLPKHALANGFSSGLVTDHGAQLLEWTPNGQPGALWLSARSKFEDGVAIRGGIPIVFPWFGHGPHGGLEPAHGFARISEWNLVELVDTPERSSVTYQLTEGQATSRAFPYDYRATFVAEIGESLELTLTIENLDAHSFVFEEALHTYLFVGDVRRIAIEGLDGTQYRDKISGKNGLMQVGDVEFTGPTDRVYSSAGELTLVDPVLSRRIRVHKHQSADTVLWNPWEQGAAAFTDMADDAWPNMVCIEGANIGENAISLEPGQQHTMGYSLYAS